MPNTPDRLFFRLQSPVIPKFFRRFLPALALFLTLAPLHAQTAPYGLIIRNGHITDGTGSPWYSGDIGIRDGRIAAIGFPGNAQAKRTT